MSILMSNSKLTFQLLFRTYIPQIMYSCTAAAPSPGPVFKEELLTRKIIILHRSKSVKVDVVVHEANHVLIMIDTKKKIRKDAGLLFMHLD